MSEPGNAVPHIESLGSGRFAIRTENGVRIAYAAATAGETWVWLDGSAYVVRTEATEDRVGPQSTDDTAMAAPMPATVRAIPVSNGQAVAAGDVLIVLEAMKMELPIKAPRDGTIRALHCAPGDLVQAGVPLVELESE